MFDIDKLTIPTLLKSSFNKYRNRPALGFVGESPITYGHIELEVNRLSEELLYKGFRKGDRIALLGDNSPNWAISYLAITGIGAICVPILTGFPDSMVKHIIRHSQSNAVIVSSKYRAKIDSIEDCDLRHVYSLDDFSSEEFAYEEAKFFKKRASKKKKNDGSDDDIDEIESSEPNEDDIAVIIYTSGTTGHSKGVILTHRSIVFDALSSIRLFPISETDRFLSILPLAHGYEQTGGMLCPLYKGCYISYLKGMPTPKILLGAMQQEKPTVVLSVPLIIDKIYRKNILPEIHASFLTNALYQFSLTRKMIHKKAGKKLIEFFGGDFRFFIFGGAPLSEDVEIFLQEAGIPYSTGYGMTETSPIITINPQEGVRIGSCGKPISGIEIKILNPNPTTHIGEILVKGPIIMQGYYHNNLATEEAFYQGEWIKTGDLGYLDKEGYLYIKGRSKNVIIGSSGENIYPEMIEQQILHYPHVLECVVYENQGKLYATAFLDYDFIDKLIKSQEGSAKPFETRVPEILEALRKEINQKLPNFSQIYKILERPEPFETTPTKKIKRYLYVPQINSKQLN